MQTPRIFQLVMATVFIFSFSSTLPMDLWTSVYPDYEPIEVKSTWQLADLEQMDQTDFQALAAALAPEKKGTVDTQEQLSLLSRLFLRIATGQSINNSK